MRLTFVPRPGSIVVCDFAGYRRPEIIKTRRVVVISRMGGGQRIDSATVIVVPLSETEPSRLSPWHHPIPSGRYAGVDACWAKCDLIAHVGLSRLDRILHRGRYVIPVFDRSDLERVRRGAAYAIGVT